MDPGALGKLGNKVDEAGSNRKVSSSSPSSDGKAPASANTSDTVELTSSAKLLEQLEKSLASLPEIDSARVADIKAAIAKGDYEIDSDAIAAAMIRFERELGD